MADFDHDGIGDIGKSLGEYDEDEEVVGFLDIHFGDGSGGVTAPVAYETGIDNAANRLVFADLDFDGLAECVAGNEKTGTAALFALDRSGAEASPLPGLDSLGDPFWEGSHGFVFDDVTGDGRADLVITNAYNSTVTTWALEPPFGFGPYPAPPPPSPGSSIHFDAGFRCSQPPSNSSLDVFARTMTLVTLLTSLLFSSSPAWEPGSPAQP